MLDEVHVTDLSPGHGRGGRSATPPRSGFDVDGRVADAERIPYDDDTFDLVVGHAVLHHIPDVELALREVLRVLKPGGRFVFAGEPTPIGDWYARRARPASPGRPPRRSPRCRRCASTWARDRRRSSTSRPGRPRWRRSSTCTRSTRASWPGTALRAGAVDVAHRRPRS